MPETCTHWLRGVIGLAFVCRGDESFSSCVTMYFSHFLVKDRVNKHVFFSFSPYFSQFREVTNIGQRMKNWQRRLAHFGTSTTRWSNVRPHLHCAKDRSWLIYSWIYSATRQVTPYFWMLDIVLAMTLALTHESDWRGRFRAYMSPLLQCLSHWVYQPHVSDAKRPDV